jgi:hypothetical protein
MGSVIPSGYAVCRTTARDDCELSTTKSVRRVIPRVCGRAMIEKAFARRACLQTENAGSSGIIGVERLKAVRLFQRLCTKCATAGCVNTRPPRLANPSLRRKLRMTDLSVAVQVNAETE